MSNSKFQCINTYDSATNTNFYVRLLPNNDPVISFSQFKSSLEIKFDFWLEGRFTLPSNLLVLNMNSNIGIFNNLVLKLVRDEIVYKKYTASFLIDISTISGFNKQCFLEELYFNVSLNVNQEVFNSSNLPSNFDKFYADLLKINFQEKILFNNYFPISKLSEYYISSKYKSNFTTLDKLPNDFFNWASKPMTIYPEFWFDKTSNFKNLEYEPINAIYNSNTNNSLFSKTFDKVSIVIHYTLNSKTKSLTLDLDKQQNNVQTKNTLFLGVKTLYNYETQTLYQSDQGVTGVYFPVPVTGSIDIDLVKNNKQYTDRIDFSFRNDFYNSGNTNIGVEVGTFTQTTGQWIEVMYA